MKQFGTPQYTRYYYVIRWVRKSGKAICPTSQLTIDPPHTHPPENYINIIRGSFKQLLNDLYEVVSIRNNSIFVNFSIIIEYLPYDRCNRQATVKLRTPLEKTIYNCFISSICLLQW